MAWRKWFVRGVVFSVVACCAGVGYVYQQWTNPAAVREQVLANLETLFPGAEVSLDSAWLRLLGGIQCGETRMMRKGDPDCTDAIYVPSAILYHDKEKLLEGVLSLRKVELFRPRFRVYRNKNGGWNLEGLIGPQRLDRSIPTLVIHQGTLLFEDRTVPGNITSLEVTDVNLISINDPLSTLSFEGVAQSPLVGKVTVTGSLDRASGELTLNVTTKDTPLGAKLLQRLTPWCPRDSLKDVEADGRVDFDVGIHTYPGRTPNLHYDVGCAIKKTSLKHPLLPVPLTDLEANVRLIDGVLTLERAEGLALGAKVTARAHGALPRPDESFSARVEIDRLPIVEDVIAKLPEKVRNVIRQFHPQGAAAVTFNVVRKDGQWADLDDGREPSVIIVPDACTSVFDKFPYPVDGITGTLEYQLRSQRFRFHLTGKAAGQPVVMRGQCHGVGDALDVTAEVQAGNIPIDDKLLSALPPGPRKIAATFHATGIVDAVGHLRRKPGQTTFENRFHIGFREATAAWDSFPLTMTGVSGRLDVAGDQWEFRDFRGQHGGGTFFFQGRSFVVPGQTQPGVDVEIQGRDVPLTAALHKALEPMPSLKKVWSVFQPTGTMNFAATIHRPTAALEDLDVRVQASGATILPTFFPFRLTECQGIVHVHDSRIDFGAVSAKHGETRMSAAVGRVDIKPGGGYHAEIPDIDVENLPLDRKFLDALPRSLKDAAEGLKLDAPVRVKSRVVVAQAADPGSRPDIYWNAQGWVKNAKLFAGVPFERVTGVVGCRGRHDGLKILGMEGNLLIEEMTTFGQTFKNAQAHFHVDEKAPTTLLAGVSAPLYGGDITGEARVDFESPVKFELNLTAAQIDLAKFGQNNLGKHSQMEGKAVGRLHLIGTSAGIQTLDGNGSCDVIAGKLYNLPLILDLLKFLGLRWPDRTAFEELHAVYRIRGPQVTLRKLELQGNAVSLSGQGDFELDGSKLHVDFYPTWARVDQMLPPALRNVPPAVSKNFLIIEMRGNVSANPDDLKFNKKLMPVVFDPILNVRDRVIGWGDPRRIQPVSQRTPTPIEKE